MKRRTRKFMLVLGVLISVIGVLLIFFSLPHSQTQTRFSRITEALILDAAPGESRFQEADITDLPAPVQRYFRYCGYLGTPKMSYIKIAYPDVRFSFGRDKPWIKIDYWQYNFVAEPSRVAYIDSSLYGLPFEGLDTYVNGAGSMTGVVAKLFTLFDQSGAEMDKSSLVTYLAEILMVPSAALQDYITWDAIDDLHAKATITCYGLSASGIFTFNQAGEMLSFSTEDRAATATDGASEALTWSVVCADYQQTNGIKRPTLFQAIWHYPDGDLVYFDGKGTITAYH